MQLGMAWQGIVLACMLRDFFFFSLIYKFTGGSAWHTCMEFVGSQCRVCRWQALFSMVLSQFWWHLKCCSDANKSWLALHTTAVSSCSVSTSCRGGRCAAQQFSSHWQKPPLSTWVTLPVPNNHWKLLSVPGINIPDVAFLHVKSFCVSHLLVRLYAFMTSQGLGRGRNTELLCGGTGLCFKACC